MYSIFCQKAVLTIHFASAYPWMDFNKLFFLKCDLTANQVHNLTKPHGFKRMNVPLP